MARPLRIEYQGACYHVMNRGNRGQEVYGTRDDYGLFIEKLARFAGMFRVGVRCWCLMPNHFHLYVSTREANLSRFMQSLLTSYAVTFNRRHDLSGHVFQGRFKAVLVEEEAYGSELGRYVHLNPVRVSALEKADVERKRRRLREYPWSSYASLIGLRPCPTWLDRDAVLGPWGRSLKAQRKAYAEHIEEGLVRDLANPLDAAAAQAVLGTERFIERIRRVVAGIAGKASARREQPQAAALGAWVSLDDLIDRVAQAYGTDQQALLRPHSRHNEARQVLLYLACTWCRGRHTLTHLAEQLGPISVGGLTHARYIMSARLAESRALRRRVARLERELGKSAGDKYKK